MSILDSNQSGILDGQDPFENPQGNLAFRRLVNKVINLIETLGSASNKLTQIFVTTIGSAAVPVTTAFVSTIGSAATAVANLFVNDIKANHAGADAIGGLATLVAGTVTVATTKVGANSVIVLSPRGSTDAGLLSIGTIVAGTSFVIDSDDAADVRTIGWQIINPQA